MQLYQNIRRRAYKVVEEMELELARMERTHRRFVRHGAVKAQENLKMKLIL